MQTHRDQNDESDQEGGQRLRQQADETGDEQAAGYGDGIQSLSGTHEMAVSFL